MSELAQMKCVACRGGEPVLTDGEIAALQPDVPEWQVIEVDGIKRLELFTGAGPFRRACFSGCRPFKGVHR